MDKVDRLKLLVRYIVSQQIAANQKDLGKKMGYTNESAFSQVINNRVEMPKDFIAKLKILIPDLNESWLVNGSGEMLASSSVAPSAKLVSETSCVSESAICAKFIALLEKKDEQIDRLLSLLEKLR